MNYWYHWAAKNKENWTIQDVMDEFNKLNTRRLNEGYEQLDIKDVQVDIRNLDFTKGLTFRWIEPPR